MLIFIGMINENPVVLLLELCTTTSFRDLGEGISGGAVAGGGWPVSLLGTVQWPSHSVLRHLMPDVHVPHPLLVKVRVTLTLALHVDIPLQSDQSHGT